MANYLPKIDFNRIYNQYAKLVKDTYYNEPSNNPKPHIKTCFGSNLKKTGYQSYTRDKSGLTPVRCRNKVEGDEIFCSVHKDLCRYLNDKTHEGEKLFDGQLYDLYKNHITDDQYVNDYIDRIINDKTNPRINLYILFFSILYELFVRKEREFLCYHFNQDEGHAKATKIREGVVELIAKKLKLEEYLNLEPVEICKHLKYLSYNHDKLSMLSLYVAPSYFDLLNINQDKEYLLKNFLLMFKLIPYNDIEIIRAKVNSVEQVINSIISDHPEYNDIYVIKTQPSEETDDTPIQSLDEYDNDEYEPIEIVEIASKRKQKRKTNKVTINDVEKSITKYSQHMIDTFSKIKNSLIKISQWCIQRKEIAEKYHFAKIEDELPYTKKLEKLKIDVIIGNSSADQDKIIKGDILKYFMLEELFTRAMLSGTYEDVLFYQTSMINFINYIWDNKDSKVSVILTICRTIVDLNIDRRIYYGKIENLDLAYYFTISSKYPTDQKLASIKLINSNILIEFANVTSLARLHETYYERMSNMIKRFID